MSKEEGQIQVDKKEKVYYMFKYLFEQGLLTEYEFQCLIQKLNKDFNNKRD